MPAFPLPIAVPATLASLAYLNARWSIPNDYGILRSLALARIRQARLEKKDRINLFYSLEEFALSPRTADLPFLVYEGRTWSFRETYDTVLRYAGWLRNHHGVKEKEIVALDFMNCPQFVFLWLALWSLGAVPAFINYNLTGTPLVHSVRVSTARLLIVDPEIGSVLTPEVEAEFTSPTFLSSTTDNTANSPLAIVHFTSTIQSSLPYQPPHRAPNSARSSTLLRDPAVLIYTSGTTGLPKPAISSWTKLHIGGRYAAFWMSLRPCTHKFPDRFYCCMPLYHSSGSVLGFSNCLMNGTTFILGHKFSTSRFWREVRESEATVLQYVGETCRYLLSAPPEPDPHDPAKDLDKSHKIRIAFGNGLRPDVWDRFKTRFGIETIAEFYAATEGTSGSWNYSSNSFASGAVGRNGVIAGLVLKHQICVVQLDYETEVPVRDPRTGLCSEVPRGAPGELLYALDAADIRSQFQGYFNNSAASEKKVVRDVLKQGDAWFRTGDVLRWDEEGRWWFVDRIGDTYRWKSENVSTAEVADVLGRFEDVEEANVYGVEVPGYEGRVGCAAVMLKSRDVNTTTGKRSETQQQAEKEALLATLATHLSTHLPKYSIPLFLRVVTHMQRTGNLKQQKHVLRAEGVDLEKIEGENGDEIWWLKPTGPGKEGEQEDGAEGGMEGGVGEGVRLAEGDGNGKGNGKGSGYVRFTRGDWEALVGGRVKL